MGGGGGGDTKEWLTWCSGPGIVPEREPKPCGRGGASVGLAEYVAEKRGKDQSNGIS